MEQNTKEWFAVRKKHIGASDAPVIAGVSPWKTPYQLWLEKVSSNYVAQEENEAMRKGKIMEEEARQVFNRETGLTMLPKVAFSDIHSFMMASLDGYDSISNTALEIKCPGRIDHQKAMDGVIPSKYMPQLQHQMIVMNLEMIYYFSYDRNSSKIIEVERDDSFCKSLISEEQKFWQCVLDFEPPEYLKNDYMVREDKEWKNLALSWKDVQQQIKSLEEKSSHLREQLISMAGNNNVMGSGIRLCKQTRKGTVNYGAIPELIGVDLNQYRKPPINVWKLEATK
jgi:putative phage-type endonuclease